MKYVPIVIFLIISNTTQAQMLNDAPFNASVAHPKFQKGTGPAILFDVAHHNFIVEMGLAKPLIEVLESDGYMPTVDSARFTKAYLEQYQIVVIMPAMPFKFGSKKEVTDEITFTTDELNVLHEWVSNGGALLMFTEHAPIDRSVTPLFNKFGIQISIGIVADSINCESSKSIPSRETVLSFNTENGLLNTAHPITRGAKKSERIHNIQTYGGGGLKGDGYTNIFKLSPTAFVKKWNGATPLGDVNSQCLAGKIGKGKVVALGDCNGFTAMYVNNAGKKFSAGMQVPGYDWKQFALNTLHWLSEN
jgi:hypothetical protein